MILEDCTVEEAGLNDEYGCPLSKLTHHHKIIVDGDVVGYIGYFAVPDDDIARLCMLCVVIKEKYRGNGYYRKCLELYLKTWHEANIKFWVITQLLHKQAKKVCKSLGFEYTGKDKYYMYHNIKPREAQLEFTHNFIDILTKNNR